MTEFFQDFIWHSSIGVDSEVSGNKKFYTKLPNTRKSRSLFVYATGSDLLIHKATQALWKLSDDGKSIVPVFDTDVLTEEDLEELGE